MIVAIAPAGTGQVKVEEFREAATAQAAVDAFVGEYSPPLSASDYVGHDTGWPIVQKPSAGNCWHYDHGSGLLTEVALIPEFDFLAPSKIGSGEVQITANTNWQRIDGVVTTPQFFDASLTLLIGRVVTAYKVAGSGAELRIVEDPGGAGERSMMSTPAALADTADLWATMTAVTDQVPSAGQHEYELQARLNGAMEASLRSTSMALLKKK